MKTLGFAGVLVTSLLAATALTPVGAADIRAFLPFQSTPSQRIQHFGLEFRGRARRIGILDAQNELAAVLLGKEIVEESNVSGADMRLAGRRGS